MASTVKPTQRAFALTLALVFLLTTIATSVFVVWAIIDEGKTDNTTNDSSLTQTPTEQTQAADQAACPFNVASGKEKLAIPESFKPSGTVSELQATDVVQGTGAEVKAGDCIVTKYHGTLASNGEKFDGNFDTDQALEFQLGVGNVIPGWDQGLVGMKVGGTRQLVIPANLAYGESGQGSIPANADLIFVVKVLEVK